MSEQTDATEDRSEDEAVEQARADREQLGEDQPDADAPQPKAKDPSGDTD